MIDADTGFISASNRGFRYGDGLFETLKSRGNHLFFAADHFERLVKGLKILQFNIPAHFTLAKFEEEIFKLLKKNDHQNMARVRVTFFRGDGGLYDETDNTPGYLVQSWALPDNAGQWNSNGLVLGIYNDVKKSCDMLSNIKHNNFLPYVMAAMQAKKEKWNDAVILNTHGRLCDTTIANIFLIKDEIIYTPALAEGCIAGIMRKNIMQQLSVNNIQVTECKITVNELMDADEMFLTNSIYNMRWVQSLAGKKYSNSFAQKIYSLLQPTIV